MKIYPYWPTEKGQQVTYGPFVIGLQGTKNNNVWTERILTLSHKEVIFELFEINP